jgi:hypothetical protein
VKTLVRQRQMLGTLLPVQGKTLNEILRDAEIQLHGVRLNEPDLSADSHSLALTVQAPEAPVMFHAMFNCYWQPLVFDLPRLEPRRASRRRWIDTDRDAPDDVCDAPLAPPVDTRATRSAPARSSCSSLCASRRTRVAAERMTKSPRIAIGDDAGGPRTPRRHSRLRRRPALSRPTLPSVPLITGGGTAVCGPRRFRGNPRIARWI